MKILISTLLILTGCGSTKTAFIDTKYSLCQDSCRLKYSRYETVKLNQCLSECTKDKYQNSK